MAASGMKAMLAPRRMLVTRRSFDGLRGSSSAEEANDGAGLDVVASPRTLAVGEPDRARCARRRRRSLALTGCGGGSGPAAPGPPAAPPAPTPAGRTASLGRSTTSAAAVAARRVLAVTSTLRRAASPTASGSDMVGSGRTRLGHHRNGVDASSCRCSSAAEVRLAAGDASSKLESDDGVTASAEVARAQASRRTSVAQMKMGMWVTGGRMRVRRGEHRYCRARAYAAFLACERSRGRVRQAARAGWDEGVASERAHLLLEHGLVLLERLAGTPALVARLEREAPLLATQEGHDEVGEAACAAALPHDDREGRRRAVEEGEERDKGGVGEGEGRREGQEGGRQGLEQGRVGERGRRREVHERRLDGRSFGCRCCRCRCRPQREAAVLGEDGRKGARCRRGEPGSRGVGEGAPQRHRAQGRRDHLQVMRTMESQLGSVWRGIHLAPKVVRVAAASALPLMRPELPESALLPHGDLAVGMAVQLTLPLSLWAGLAS